MARTWLSIRVDLVGGGGLTLWPRPGRIFAAARSHSFADLATATDDAFARWDRAHLHMFDLGEPGGLLVDQYWDDPPEDSRADAAVKLSTLTAGQQFAYVFDLGDNWAHLCTVGAERIDPLDTLGITPDRPMPYWGWGSIPDQYGRTWDGDDGETAPPPNPDLTDLPALQPGWGPHHR
ncbi:MAG: plasmid pRiA4b ORF-3 family protein [Actinomycetota bacterium]|nr:plasmid pRiA4b ORF-3 family protein [Actinomycetota bacterium]